MTVEKFVINNITAKIHSDGSGNFVEDSEGTVITFNSYLIAMEAIENLPKGIYQIDKIFINTT